MVRHAILLVFVGPALDLIVLPKVEPRLDAVRAVLAGGAAL
jgi:hypothetical protein